MKKRILSLLMCLCLSASLLPGTALAVENTEKSDNSVASVTIGDATTYYDTIEEAWAAATAEGVTSATVTLLKDVELANADGLKLGDYTSKSSNTVTFKGESFTLSAKRGDENTTYISKCISVQSGTLNIESGTISSNYIAIEVLSSTSTVNIKGGTVQAIKADGIDLNTALDCAGGATTISDNAEIKSDELCIFARVNDALKCAPTVRINGGTVETSGTNSFALSCTGGLTTLSGNAVIHSKRTGIGISETGRVIVNGGSIVCNGEKTDACGIDVQGGKLEVHGGTIGDENCSCGVLMGVSRFSSGTYSSGDAEISGGTIKGKQRGLETTNRSAVTISGTANISATDGFGVLIAALDKWKIGENGEETVNLPEKKLTIKGGTMTGSGEFSAGLYVAGTTPIIQGGTFNGGIRIEDRDDGITLASLLKDGCAYFKNGNTQLAASELTGKRLTDTVTVKAAQKETELTITASVDTVNVDPIPVALADGEDGAGETPADTKKVVTLTVNGPLEVLDAVTVTCDAGLVLTKVANETSKWTCDLPNGAEADKPYTFTASFAGNDTWAPATTKCIVMGDGTVKDCSDGNHTWDEGVQTTAPTASTPGVKTFTCTVCGKTKTEAIPATGGSSSSGSSSSGTTTTPSTPVTNPDGSTTTTTEDKTTGTVTETTKKPDGSQTVVETKKDGTVTTKDTDKDGNKTETVAKPDGSSVTKVEQTDGTTASVSTDTSGKVEAEVALPAAVVDQAQKEEKPVALPIPEVKATASANTAPVVTVKTGSADPVKVEIPTADVTPGTVAVIVNADGSEEVIKTSVPTENGLTVALPDGATVKIVDNSKSFADVPTDSWAADAVNFSASRELFSGTGVDSFSPEEPMTRAMLMTVLARFDGADTSGGDTWYEKGMDWAVANGVSDGSAPDGNISREQLAVMLWRYSGSPAPSGSLDGFTDAGAVSGYAQEAMLWAVENGVVSGFGDGTLAPQGQATRAQVAQMMKNFITK